MYQTIKTVFHHISKHLGVRQKYSAKRRIFSLFTVYENVSKHSIKAQYETTYCTQN